MRNHALMHEALHLLNIRRHICRPVTCSSRRAAVLLPLRHDAANERLHGAPLRIVRGLASGRGLSELDVSPVGSDRLRRSPIVTIRSSGHFRQERGPSELEVRQRVAMIVPTYPPAHTPYAYPPRTPTAPARPPIHVSSTARLATSTTSRLDSAL